MKVGLFKEAMDKQVEILKYVSELVMEFNRFLTRMNCYRPLLVKGRTTIFWVLEKWLD